MSPRRFIPTLQPATREVRDKARAFLNQVDARGGTELATGFLAAAKLLEGGGGDILIMTDGQVSGTEKILESARSRRRPAALPRHRQRQPGSLPDAARARDRRRQPLRDAAGARGSLGGRSVRLHRTSRSPRGLKAGANVQPQPASLVFSGTPVLLFGEGEGPVELTWDGGQLNLPVSLQRSRVGETVWLLQGSRLITDWESRYASADALAPLEKRKQSRVAMRLLELSRTYGLASREMSLVAVVKRAGDRPGELPETRVVPVGMAQDTESCNAYFQRRSVDGLLGAGSP